jgi:hypothetical protein
MSMDQTRYEGRRRNYGPFPPPSDDPRDLDAAAILAARRRIDALLGIAPDVAAARAGRNARETLIVMARADAPPLLGELDLVIQREGGSPLAYITSIVRDLYTMNAVLQLHLGCALVEIEGLKRAAEIPDGDRAAEAVT